MCVRFFKSTLIMLLSLTLIACATSLKNASEFQQGQRYFQDGYYKRAIQELLPPACDGNPQAQYAIGYLYYYGYGVAQDTEVGYFWIHRAASQYYRPAQEAEVLIQNNKRHETK
jgi:TPR repeat protein